MPASLSSPSASAASAGCGASRCGGTASQIDALDSPLRQKVQDHPCYSAEAHRHFARMHVAVAPACNIQCNYCNRKYDCSNESRPGVVSEVLSPEQAVHKVLAVAAAIPQMSVLGIAGPGDALANAERSFAVFDALARRAPDLRLCLSTNGLMLPAYVERIVAARIDHVTITINCLDPDIGARIYPWIFWNHRRIHGREAARILVAQQQLGLEMLVARGVLVKVNSVMIPGINDAHLPEVSRVVRAKGAFLHNVMPLISDPAHGTAFGLAGQRGPDAAELAALQDACEGGASMMRHCQQCRADAVGMLGEDRGAEFTLEKIAHLQIDEAAAMQRRVALRAQINAGPGGTGAAEASAAVLPFARAATPPARGVRMAVASRDGRHVDQHFGHAERFHILEVDGEGVRWLGERAAARYCGGEAECGEQDNLLARTVATLADCEVVLCARIGMAPWQALESAGIRPDGEHAMEPVAAAAQAVWHALRDAGRLTAAPFEDQKRA
ncbi:MAG: nitrogenase cofactor biosynthesis protein NifB [Candidatus Dactylopiibacterium sp.]|nr:nitrogenase cofactor biosynthesis protein NifB [Candidatus Dactylopiibacterium sp.]